MRVAIELNDTSIIIHDGMKLLNNSPGYIVEAEQQVWFGNDACERAFLYSNQCRNKFWYEIARADGNNINQANLKLATRHLAHMWNHVSDQVNTVVMIVPESFTKIGLGLLLGICKELDIPVRAMVHQAILCPYQYDHKGDTFHVDIQLHNTVITHLKKTDRDFIAGNSKVLEGTGLVKLYEIAAEYLAKEFIKKTRLDPMHNAELEQQLYDYLPKWLRESWKSKVIECKLEYKNNSYEIQVNTHEIHNLYNLFIETISKSITTISSDRDNIICLSQTIDSQFGFSYVASKHQFKIRVLNTTYLAKRSLEHGNELISSDGQVYLIKQLPYTQLTDPLDGTYSLDNNYEIPNYVLFRDHAYEIKDRIVLVKNRLDDFELFNEDSNIDDVIVSIKKSKDDVYIEFELEEGITINKESAQSLNKLDIGDCINIPGCNDAIKLIKVDR